MIKPPIISDEDEELLIALHNVESERDANIIMAYITNLQSELEEARKKIAEYTRLNERNNILYVNMEYR